MDEPRGIDYLERAALDELPVVLEACSVELPILIGHSDGGTIALHYAAHHPTVAVVTEAAHIYVEEAAKAGIRIAVDTWHEGTLEGKLERYHGEKTRRVFWSWADTWLAPWFNDWNIRDQLSGVTCPSLLLQGRQDQYATERHLAEIAARVSGPSRTELIADCGHAPHLEAPNTTLDLMSEFIRTMMVDLGGTNPIGADESGE
jgi:pimeloyl-ACP methyl ester carboxylesterase